MTYKHEVFNHIIKELGFTKYLEIGVANPIHCFNYVICDQKDSVDPGVEFAPNPVKYKFTSDDFFEKLEAGLLDRSSDFEWDLIFIDGLHISYQVDKDIINALKHLSPKGFIILHDCNPFLYEYQQSRLIEDYWGQAWNGTVWKAFYKILCSRADLEVFTLPIDEGLGVITRGEGRILPQNENPFFEYKVLHANINSHLNIVPLESLDFILEKTKQK